MLICFPSILQMSHLQCMQNGHSQPTVADGLQTSLAAATCCSIGIASLALERASLLLPTLSDSQQVRPIHCQQLLCEAALPACMLMPQLCRGLLFWHCPLLSCPGNSRPCRWEPLVPGTPTDLLAGGMQEADEDLQTHRNELRTLSSRAAALSTAAAAASMGLASIEGSGSSDAVPLLGACLDTLHRLLALEGWTAVLSLQQQVGALQRVCH